MVSGFADFLLMGRGTAWIKETWPGQHHVFLNYVRLMIEPSTGITKDHVKYNKQQHIIYWV